MLVSRYFICPRNGGHSNLALSFLSSLGKHPDRSPWEEYAQVLLSTNELSFRQ